ncbi:MAG: Na/Pi symporter [Myxococcales bacterium]|nr:Na/Pi symporter [Myxococcales bacterium]
MLHEPPTAARSVSTLRTSLRILPPLLGFLVGIRGMGLGFKLLGGEVLDAFFAASENPFVGLLIGILGTSIVQSSSVVTSMVVGLVAAPVSPLPIHNAIPMVMGANIGTTVTSTVVSLGHMSRPAEFRRAIAAGTCDDFFNLVAVSVLLPVEIATGFLQSLSGMLVSAIPRTAEPTLGNPVAGAADAILDPLRQATAALASSERGAAVLFLCLAMGIVFGGLVVLVRQLRRVAGGRLERSVTPALDASPLVGLATGAVATAMVQSSSLTLSLLVPLAGTGIMTLEQVFPLVLGANLGTTITAFMASTAVPVETFSQAVQISLVHMLFNTAGILLIYPWPPIRRVPLGMARWLGRLAVRSKLAAMAAVVGLFYLLPALALVVWRNL